MKRISIILIVIFFLVASFLGCTQTPFELPEERNGFWNNGKEVFDLQEITPKGIHFCILVAKDGSVLAFFPNTVRRSTDGGETWSDEISLGVSANKSKVLDENTGDIIFFSSSDSHGSKDNGLNWYRSKDNGLTWNWDGAGIENKLETLTVGDIPIFLQWPVGSYWHYVNSPSAENGITLQFGANKGRLVVPVRVQRRIKNGSFPFPGKLDLNLVIYSDDGGKTWIQGNPTFPFGKDESAIAEISNGTIYHNSRNALDNGNKYISWSYDGGESWKDHSISKVLPDGPSSGKRVSEGHFGLMAGLVRLPYKDKDILIFSNVDSKGASSSENGRTGMTVWASFDGAKTWPIKRLIDSGPSDYSGLSAGRKGTPSEGLIYLMYGRDRDNLELAPRIARFNLAWLVNGELTGDGTIPEWVNSLDN